MNKNLLSLSLVGILAVVYLGCCVQLRSCNGSGKHGGFGVAPAGCQPYPAFQILFVNITLQHASEWCWAASGEMCMEYINNDGVAICQCDQANKVFCPRGCSDGSNCCTGDDPFCSTYLMDVSAPCNRPSWPDFKDYGFTALSTRSLTTGEPASSEFAANQCALS